MNNPLELYASLVLTILGFILPVLTILLSLFPEGVRILTGKYENEKKQSEENIKNEIKKRDFDNNALKKILDALEKKKRQAENRLEYLNPLSLASKIFVPFALSFMAIIVAMQLDVLTYLAIALSISVLCLVYGLSTLWVSLSLLIEVSQIVSSSKRETNDKIIELLSKLVEKNGNAEDKIFLKIDEITAKFNDKLLTPNSNYSFSVSKKYEIPISIVNIGEIMAKRVELGLIFPKDVLIENTSNLSIYTDEKTQIVRFYDDFIQAMENCLEGKMGITFLKSGEYKVDAFIKGENVKHNKFSFKITVID